MNDAFDDSPEARTVRRLRRVMAAFTALLVASTWPLWTPGTEFPDIPWFAWAAHWPPEDWDWIWLASLGGLIASQFLTMTDDRPWVSVLRCVLFGGALMSLPTDQHRLQPWVWQMLIGTSLIAVAPNDRGALRSLRVFTLSIYIWSAISKVDLAFLDRDGQWLLEGLAESVGLSPWMWPNTMKRGLAALLPVVEITVAILLMIPRTRRYGMWAAILMHGMLMLTLGPLGLRHEWGVFVWNAFFGVQAWLLFRNVELRRRVGGIAQDSSDTAKPQAMISKVLMSGVCLLPALSLVGRWDWWPSWAVYSSRPAKVLPSIGGDDISKLPSSLEPFVKKRDFRTGVRPVLLAGWSYETCWCPMYPQERYRLAVIDAVIHRQGALADVLISRWPNRWTGETVRTNLSPEEFEQRLETYWFNTRERGRAVD